MGERETNRGATKALRVYCHYLSRKGEEETRGREDEEATRAFCSGTAVNAPNGRTEHSLFVENQVL